MSYTTLMVHLELGRTNVGLLRVTAELAERFGANVIGIAARQPMQLAYGDAYVAGDLIEQDRDEIARELKAAEVEFRIALQPSVPVIEWRSAQIYAYLSDYIANEARSADLIVTGVASTDFFDAGRVVNVGDLVMQAGRPVLIVPTAATSLKLDRVLIGWKDTRETRRAISDAIPLLKHAKVVNVVEIVAEADLPGAQGRMHDVVGWLKRHGIRAEGSSQRSTGEDSISLYDIGEDMSADLLVAGAYGHSRLREWALGGVTRDLLLRANRLSFVSH